MNSQKPRHEDQLYESQSNVIESENPHPNPLAPPAAMKRTSLMLMVTTAVSPGRLSQAATGDRHHKLLSLVAAERLEAAASRFAELTGEQVLDLERRLHLVTKSAKSPTSLQCARSRSA